jgi:hypothetical protein
MNAWGEFALAVVFRFVCGLLLGCFACVVFGLRTILHAFAEDRFPYERFMWWGLIGGVICVLTTPRDAWPWMKE